MPDNQTTVAYINNMGDKNDQCNPVARKIWFWYISNNTWLYAVLEASDCSNTFGSL
jgi:hypothetical protein